MEESGAERGVEFGSGVESILLCGFRFRVLGFRVLGFRV